jgi:DNA-binding GntR family transcriptional regulator
VHSEHSQLLRAIGEGKAERAAEAMLQHIGLIESRMTLEEREESSVDLKRAFAGIV